MRAFQAAALTGLPHVRHGFFTRQGGVSTGIFESLNTGYGSGDSAASVTENRRRIFNHLNARFLVAPKQTHSTTVIHVETPWDPENAPEGDALVTTTKGVALAIQTADCVPILFADRKKGIIGAAHAGWGGALKGVVTNTVQAMQALGAQPQDLAVAIGPCIRLASYEVSIEFLKPFLEKDSRNSRYFHPGKRPGHMMFDIASYVRDELKTLGIKEISDTDQDTYADPELFFSYRRSTHQVEPDYGRQMSVIVLE